jgi:hypothetical protein
MKDEALKLALEALEREEYRLRQTGQSQVYSGIGFAITAIKQALAAQPVPVQPVPWSQALESVWAEPDDTAPAQPAVPDAFGTREGEHPQYIQGWNDCRAEMLKGMKP